MLQALTSDLGLATADGLREDLLKQIRTICGPTTSPSPPAWHSTVHSDTFRSIPAYVSCLKHTAVDVNANYPSQSTKHQREVEERVARHLNMQQRQ